MKRFGVRLAAGLAVTCLGSLAVLQAQRDKNEQSETDWPTVDVAAGEPPAPLGIDDAWPAPPDTQIPATLVRGNNGQFSDSQVAPPVNQGLDIQRLDDQGHNQNVNPIQLSSYDQPVENEQQGEPDNFSSFSAARLDSAPYVADASHDADAAHDLDAMAAPGSFSMPPTDDSTEMPAPMALAPLSMPALSPPAAAKPAIDDPTAGPGQAPGSIAENPEVGFEQELDDLPPIGSGYDPSAGPSADPSPAPATVPKLTPIGQAASDWPQQGSETPPVEASVAQNQPLPSFDSPAASPTSPTASEFAAPTPLPAGRGASSIPADASAPPARTAMATTPPSLGSGYVTAAAATTPLLQTVDASEVLSEPGTRDLEGAQAPSVVVQKRAPGEVRVGKPAEFVISVKNVGTVSALDVRVFDTVPDGATLETTQPRADQLQDMLVWQLGDLRPGEERALTVTVVPQQEGELGSVARVTFEAAASVRTMATRPVVTLQHSVPPQVLIGQQLEMDLEISNTGSGSSENVYVLAELPDGLETSNGRSLKLPIGVMPPGDTRRHLLRMKATKAGPLSGTIQLVDADGVISDATIDVEVTAPQLEVALEGPSMRYLERQATYRVQIANSGTADASDIDLVAYLDRGLKFVSTDFEGAYDPTRHAVSWALAELKANEVGEVPLTLLPVEPGVQKVRLETTGAMGIAANFERELTIDTLAELSFTIADNHDPIEPGADTVYEIRVQNKGTREDTNVVLEVQIPNQGLELITAEPSAGTDGQGKVIFEPISRIPAKGEQVYRIRVRGITPDTHVVRATVASSQSKRAVTKEESTTVYSDR